MNVFLTGATGFIGSALLHELIATGHNVTALARTREAADTLRAAGANPHTGDLQDLQSLRTGASNADAILHTGFIHDFSRFKEVCETDRQAILAMGEVFSGSDRPIIVTSGTGLLAPGRLGLESDRQLTGGSPRIATEEAVDVLTEKGIRTAVVRLPPSVHGQGDHGFVPLLINLAREKGVSAYIEEGTNHWSAVHRFDAARLYRLAVNQAFEPGTRFHGVAEEGIPFRAIAEVIGRRLNLPVKSLTNEEAAAHFTWFTHFAGMDSQSSSKQTRERLQWQPREIGLLDDVDQPYYFN